MKIIRLSMEKISAQIHPELAEIINEHNALRKDPVKIALAVDGDTVAGMIIYEAGYLVHIQVNEEMYRIGVGRYLLKFLSAEIGNDVCTKVEKNNNTALCFFLANGWEITGSVIALGDDLNYFRLRKQTTRSTVRPIEKAVSRYIDGTPIFISTTEGTY